MKLNIAYLGRIEYDEALKIQEALLRLRIEGKADDFLLLLEHPPVLTLGRRGEYSNIKASREELEANGVRIFEINRGGDVTYHGPGQLVGYPIINISNFEKDVRRFVLNLEEIFIRLLKEKYGVNAGRGEGKYTGVWVDNEKITAIGIAVKRWVTMHGFAFNINTDLSHFNWIVPCGLSDRGITSLSKLTGSVMDFNKASEEVAGYFCEIFGFEPVILDKNEILNIPL